MKKISNFILKTEECLAAAMLCAIACLVFFSALARTVGKPINWAQDVALLLFGWLTFIGGDVITRADRLVNIDMLTNKFPKVLQKILGVVFDLMIIAFLALLVYFGVILVSQSWTRMFNTLKLSYAWCTLSVPVGSALMITSFIQRAVADIRKPAKEWGRKA